MTACRHCLPIRAHWTWLGLLGLAATCLAGWIAALSLATARVPSVSADLAAGPERGCVGGGDYCPIESDAHRH